MALDFNPQERGMFTAPRMPNATWGGLVQGYRQMGSPLEAIGAGLDRSARISNQNKLMDLLGSGKLDLSDPGKAYQQAAPLLNRTTESAVQNFGDLLTRSLQSRQEKRADVAQELAKDQAQWNRENQLAELGFKNLGAELEQKRFDREGLLLPQQKQEANLRNKLLQLQIEGQQKALKQGKAPKTYINPKTGDVHYMTPDQAKVAIASGKDVVPAEDYVTVEGFKRGAPATQARSKKIQEWVSLPDSAKKRLFEEGLAKDNWFEDVDLTEENMKELMQVENTLEPPEWLEYINLPISARPAYLMNKISGKVEEKPFWERYVPWGSDVNLITNKKK